jgi:predicted alpha/beta-fold hydrolase
MTYLYDKFCKDSGRVAFAAGCSLGGNVLANMVGRMEENCFLRGVFIIHAPIKQWECSHQLVRSMFGFYDRALGRNLNELMLKHEEILKDHLKETLRLDLR